MEPSCQQTEFAAAEKRGKLRLLAYGAGAEGSVKMLQDARAYATLLDGEESVEHTPDPQRRVYVYVAQGSVYLKGVTPIAGDGAQDSE